MPLARSPARLLVPATLALVLIAAVALPQASAEEERGDHFVVADGKAEGRFVSFGLDAEAGVVCDWSFEGRTVIRSIAGVSGGARTDGRSIVLGEAEAQVEADGCGTTTRQANTTTTSRDTEDDDEDDEPRNGTSSSATSTSTPTGPDDEEDEDDGTTTSRSTTSRPTTAAPRDSAIGVRAKLHDTPNGAIAFDLDAGKQVRLDLAADVDAKLDGAKVRLSGDALRASLFVNQGSADVDVRVEGSTVTLSADGKAKVHFRVDDADLEDDDGGAMEEHVDDGDVACEVFVSDDDAPHVVELGDANVVVSTASHTSVRVDLDIDLQVDLGSDGERTTTVSQSPSPSATRTQTQSASATATPSRTAAPPPTTSSAPPHECGCAAKVIILDVDVTVLVLEADDDLLVRLDGQVLAKADSVEDALTIEAGEDPEALVVVDQEQEVKVLLSLGEGRNQVSLEALEGESFQTREPERRAPARASQDDGMADLDSVDVDDAEGTDGIEDEDAAGDASVPGPGFGLVALAVIAAGALALRRRL